jgi:tetratricopeptide (TPR) repeat protein
VAYTSEIEKLEKRWAENPRGRNFAPLADAYRKAGELDRAIELCKAGLERHPDYVSAHIVYGRCLIDQKNETAASEVFRKVLTLDPENVLGLKILAEIAERGKRYDEAVDWLNRLLSADPMNGDAAEALVRAKGKAAQATLAAQAAQAAPAPPAPPAAPAAVPPPQPAKPAQSPSTAKTVPTPAIATAPVARAAPTASPPPPPAPPPPPPPPARTVAPPAEPVVRLVPEERTAPMAMPEYTTEEPSSTELQVTGTPRDIETFDGTLDFDSAAHSTAKAEGLEVQEEVVLQPQDMVVEGLAHTQYESGAFTPPSEEELAEVLPQVDLPLIMPEDLAETPPVAAAPRAPAAPGGASATSPPAAVRLSDDDGAADTAALSRAEPVLTETMAELYLKQGHQEDALRVYQALLAQRPGDARLRARVNALMPGGGTRGGGWATGESLPDYLKRILTGRPGAADQEPASSPAPPAHLPAQQFGAASPLESAFSVAAAQPEPGPEITAPGEATRPAADSISLDAVFGDEGPRSLLHGAEPPPAPASAPSPAAAPQQTGGFSFDQFFSAPAAGPAAPSGAPPPASPAPGAAAAKPRSSGGRPRAPEDEGDLDQFQAWLKGLKS